MLQNNAPFLLTGAAPQVPSSAFRVYSLIHPGTAWWPLAYSAGLVLPLMGFWNTVIYVTTSWSAIRSFVPSVPLPGCCANLPLLGVSRRNFRTKRMGRPRTLSSLEEGRSNRLNRPASLSDSMTGLNREGR